MSQDKKKKKTEPAGPREDEAPTPANDQGKSADDDVRVSGWSDSERGPRWKTFPASGQTEEPFRVSFTRPAYADLVSHAKENLDAEVCGVVVGELCEDDHGLYVDIRAIVCGTSTKHGSAHVTYTQETWNRIHQEMEDKHAGLQIVGWYHSHPGFGVEFSDMDLFIQDNFFSAPGQIAFVTDPLGGEEAICVKLEGTIRHLPRFWVDGRERHCHSPGGPQPSSPPVAGSAGASDAYAKALRAMEDRLGQTIHAVEDLRVAHYRFLLGVGMVVAAVLIWWIASGIYNALSASKSPPDLKMFSEVPLKIGGQWVWIGSKVITLTIPPDLAARLDQEEKKAQEAAAAQKQQAQKEPAPKEGGAPGSAPATPPGPAAGTGSGPGAASQPPPPARPPG